MSLYNGGSIKVLEGLEAVRLRPGMYIGSTTSKGLHHLVYEILDNAVDESLEGVCDTITIRYRRDGAISVKDNGRGIPVELHPKGIPAVRVVMTVLHAGGKFDNNSYKKSGGLHGVGASVVNALSNWLEVEVYADGNIYRDRYEKGGTPVTKLENGLLPVVGKTNETGTQVTFLPDDTIFETIKFKPEIIKKRLKELAYLNKNLKFIFINEQEGEEEILEIYENEGIIGFIREINSAKDVAIPEIIYISGEKNGTEVEIAMQYTNDYTENIISFCNNINTIEGGTHVSGFKTSFTRVVNQYAKELGIIKGKDDNFDGKDIRSGLTAIISIKYSGPQFEGQTKTKLGNSEVRGIVDEITAIESQNFFDRNLELLREVIGNALKSFKLRKSEEKARNNTLSKLELTVNGKLTHCNCKDPKKTEIYIVEGDSAGGSGKSGRNRKTQAILPLKGKILNVEKQNISALLDNTEITTMIASFGCGFGDDFNINKLKYGKIIILTDADVDGAHIRTLILTFFYRYMPELIYAGKVFIGMPPLYKVTYGKKVQYLYTPKQLKEFTKENKNISNIQRYKGLGEMNPDQLWETTLNPETRYLKKVVIEDAVSADEVTSTLMGSKVPPRKQFINERALTANIDL